MRRKTLSTDLIIMKNNGNKEAAKLMGVSVSRVKRYRNKYRIPSPVSSGRQSRFCAEDVEQMIGLLNSGFSAYDVARLKGCTEGGVRYAVKKYAEHGHKKYPPRVIDKKWKE